MILIGDKLVPFDDMSFILNIEDIKKTKGNSILLFNYNENLLVYCNKNELSSAIIVSSIKEAIYCNNLNAKYIISEKDLSIEIQKIADNYMYDSKNLTIINSNEDFELIAKYEIDGVIYRDLIK